MLSTKVSLMGDADVPTHHLTVAFVRLTWDRRILWPAMWIGYLTGVALALSMLGAVLGQPTFGVCAGLLSVALVVLARYLLR
ncbi:hypothetical protein [Rhodococcus sp. H29-C3]|uniref:hypothetical protein n=1 Tax=Rhodococcus sp. H29-C3 TaxID=3046307 RepID=UPI0024BB8806|nr:hypothetical protein [Rhodococcus sp. H29-C3]MDJ0363510.1 hypothetical protein [Rhodococcus sp. H29-C3]